MPTTPTYGFPYPALSDPPNGPSQIQSLATSVESTLTAQIGTLNTSIAAVTTAGTQMLAGHVLTQVGTYLTTSGTTELALPKLSLTGVSYSATDVIGFTFTGRLSGGSAGDTFEFRVRQTTALTGTLIRSARNIVRSANQSNETYTMVWIPGVAQTNQTFHLSLVKIVGSGNLAVEGDANSAFWAYKLGTTATFTAVP